MSPDTTRRTVFHPAAQPSTPLAAYRGAFWKRCIANNLASGTQCSARCGPQPPPYTTVSKPSTYPTRCTLTGNGRRSTLLLFSTTGGMVHQVVPVCPSSQTSDSTIFWGRPGTTTLALRRTSGNAGWATKSTTMGVRKMRWRMRAACVFLLCCYIQSSKSTWYKSALKIRLRRRSKVHAGIFRAVGIRCIGVSIGNAYDCE
jgi:hypothetical protein